MGPSKLNYEQIKIAIKFAKINSNNEGVEKHQSSVNRYSTSYLINEQKNNRGEFKVKKL